MRTDEHLYTIFRYEPRWLFLLSGWPDPGECVFRSEQFKSIQRTCDGLIEPVDPEIWCYSKTCQAWTKPSRDGKSWRWAG